MSDIAKWLGDDAEALLGHVCTGVPKEQLHPPGPDFIDRVMAASDRRPNVLRNMQALFDHGRLAGTGYVSILPVDQGIEHSAGASLPPIPSTSTRPTSSSWPLKVGAMPWPRRSAGWRR